MQTVKWLQVLLFNTNFIQLNWFIWTQSNGSKYCYVIPILQSTYTLKKFQVLLFSTNNSIQHYSFICTQLNGSKYWYVSITIQFKSFVYTQLIVKISISNNSIQHKSFVCMQFEYQTVLFDPLIEPYQVLPLWVRVDQGVMAMKRYSIFPKDSGLEPHN